MRTTQLALGALAVATFGTSLAPAAHAQTTTTTHERGNVIECTGTIKGKPVYASLYENNVYANVIQVVIGDGDDQVGNSREVADGFIEDKQVYGALRVGGKRAVIEGHAARYGKRIAVHDEFDDAGQHIVVDGFHRKLSKDLTLTWRHRTVPLACGTAFFYDLTTTKTDIE